eukprot:c24948_g1_i2 orf=196-885(+)
MLSLTTLSPPPHLLLSLPCFPSRLLASSLCFVGTQFTPQRLQPWAAFRWASLALINCQRYLTKSRMENFELAASQGQDPVVEAPPTLKPTRRVIEHVTLFQMNEDFSKDQATVMLDYLYTMQYQMRGIIAVSLGYVNNNAEGCTHASVMRFPSVETLKAYYEHPIRTMITNEYIIPYQHSGEDDKMNEASDKERLLCRNSFAWTMKQMCKMTLCPYFDGERSLNVELRM